MAFKDCIERNGGRFARNRVLLEFEEPALAQPVWEEDDSEEEGPPQDTSSLEPWVQAPEGPCTEEQPASNILPADTSPPPVPVSAVAAALKSSVQAAVAARKQSVDAAGGEPAAPPPAPVEGPAPAAVQQGKGAEVRYQA